MADEFVPPLVFSDNEKINAHVMDVIDRAMARIDDPMTEEEDRQKIRDILLKGLERQEELTRQLEHRLTEIEKEEQGT